MARLFSFCIGAALAVSGATQAKEISLQDIVEMKRVNQAITTSSGDHTAFTRVRPRKAYSDDDGASYIELFVLDSEGNTTPFITGDVRIRSISFGPDEKHIYYLSQREDDKHTSLYRIPLRGGESSKVLSHETAIGSFSHSSNGNYVAFTASEKGAEKSDELSKKGFKAEVYEEEMRMRHVFVKDLRNEDAKPKRVEFKEHVLSAQFRPEHEQLLLRVAPTTFVDDSMMKASYVLVNFDGEEVVRFDTEGKLGNAEFSADGSQLAFLGAEDQHDPAVGRLMLANLRDGSVRDLMPGYRGHVGDLLWQDNNHLVYMGNVGTETEVVRMNVDSGNSDTLVSPGAAIVSDLVGYRGDNAFTLLAHRPAHPQEVFHLNNGELERLTDSNPWLADVEQPRQETITYEARDGLELEGVLVYPLNYKQGQRVPVIMSIHGGPEAHIRNGWNDRYSSPTWYAAQQGYATFFPNYRGSTGHGVEFSKLGQNDYAGKEFDDIVDAKEHLVEIGLADADRVGITGGSYGGYASAWGATKQTEHFAASVMFVGISNNLSKFGTTDIPNEMHLVHARSYPWDKWQWYLERSPIYHAEDARTPILIMHGKEDTRVHPSQSMELYRYLKVHGNVPVRLVLYPGEGHGNSRVGSQLDYAMRLMRWMDYYLVEQNDGIPEHELPHAEKLESNDD